MIYISKLTSQYLSLKHLIYLYSYEQQKAETTRTDTHSTKVNRHIRSESLPCGTMLVTVAFVTGSRWERNFKLQVGFLVGVEFGHHLDRADVWRDS